MIPLSSPSRSAPARAPDEEDEADPSSITDVFANMLEINEDMLAVAAECHADDDAEGSIAYQRLLHRNLMEMANFIDSCFGVYTKSENGDDTSSLEDTSDASELLMDDEPVAVEAGTTAAGFTPEAIDDALSTTIARRFDEQEEGDANIAPSDGIKPEPSALLATLEADEAAKEKQRTKKQWIKSREQIIEQESASAGLNEAAERMATVTATMMKAPVLPVLPPPTPLLPMRLPLPLAATPAPVPVPATTGAQSSTVTMNTSTAEPESAGAVALASPSPAVTTVDAIQSSTSEPARGDSSTPASPSPPAPQDTSSPTAPTQPPPPAPLAPDEAAQFFAPPLGGLAPFLPIAGAKIALPSTNSLVSVLYPVAASVYPPIQLSTVCPMCVLQNKSAHECRMVLKHVTPSLLLDPASVPGLGLVQWPPPPPMETHATPARPAVSNRQIIAKSLKRMCEECRKCHFSVHRCRVVLQHTAPEWQPATPAPVAPRRRKTAASRKDGGANQVS